MPDVPRIYDIQTDEFRDVTQYDVDMLVRHCEAHLRRIAQLELERDGLRIALLERGFNPGQAA